MPTQTDQQEIEGEQISIFSAIEQNNFEVISAIIDINPQILKQENESGETPIMFNILMFYKNPSEHCKNTLKIIFQKQFGRDLATEEINNIIDFVENFNFLKLFYGDLGQGFSKGQLEKILSAFLPKKEDLPDGLIKNLVEIYEKITQKEIVEIKLQEGSEKNKSLHIYKSGLRGHRAYFIFHVDDDHLTKISYCDGNKVCDDQKIGNTFYINGATILELKVPLSFKRETTTLDKNKYFQNFVEKTSQEKDSEVFYKEFAKILEEKKIDEIEFSTITYSIPTKEQKRGNCAIKSMRLLTRYILEIIYESELFTFDPTTLEHRGEGYQPHKELKQEIVNNATEKLIESVKKIEKDFIGETRIFEKIYDFYERSFNKEFQKLIKKKEVSITKFLPIAERKFDNFKAQIIKEKLCSYDEEFQDNLLPFGLQNYLWRIFENNISFEKGDIKKIGFLLKKKEVKINGFLDLKFPSPEVKNHFTKLILKYGDEEQKSDFVQQISLFDADKRGKFFEGLSEKRIKLILGAIELEKQEQFLYQEAQDGLSLDKIAEELSKILSKKPSTIAVNPTIGKEMRAR
jgi:hypothetical protein